MEQNMLIAIIVIGTILMLPVLKWLLDYMRITCQTGKTRSYKFPLFGGNGLLGGYACT